MQPEDIKKILESNLPDCRAVVLGDDGQHFEARVISPCFEGKSLLARQRQVYKALGDHILNGTIHAISIKAYTPEESK